MTTLEQSSQSQNQIILKEWTEPNLKDDFSYLLELARSTLRSHDMIKSHVLRLGIKLAEKYMSAGMPEMVPSIQSNIQSYLHKNEVFEFDAIIEAVFWSGAWTEQRKVLEQSYGVSTDVYNNVLGKQPKHLQKASIDSLKASLKWAQQNPEAIPDELKRDVISQLDKTKSSVQVEAMSSGIALEPSDSEVDQTRTQSQQRKQDQLKTPTYKIEEIHKERQEIVKEGLQACIDIFTEMRDNTINEIPIQSDEEAFSWRDAFVDLANNYTALGDNKHRMDFVGWAKTLKNIQLYGAEKGLKVSGQEITDGDINLIDENTLPLHFYTRYKKIGLSYISKEHLDSKGVLIANVFVDMVNRMSWMASAAEAFSYMAKIRGIRAIAVSNKLSDSK